MARVSRGKFHWLRDRYRREEFLVILPTKLTDAQIAAFDKPLDKQRKMLTDNPKLNALLERPVRWSER